MERPPFLRAALTCLVLDIVFLIALLFIGQMAIFYLLFLVPAVATQGFADNIKWARERNKEKSYLGGLAMLLCASSLIFLISVVAMAHLTPPIGGDLWLIILLFYFQVWVIRLIFASVVTLGVALICLLFAPGRFSKFNALCAGLTSGCGLYIVREEGQASHLLSLLPDAMDSVMESLSGPSDPVAQFFIVLLFAVSFGHAVMQGAVLQWAVASYKS